MLQRGRKTAQQLVSAGFSVARIETPSELNEEQGLLWREIVASQHADCFNAGNAPLLVALVRHIHEERRLGERIAAFQDEWLDNEEGMRRYDLLAKNHERQSKAIVSISTKLRLTNQSRYRADKAETLSRRVPAILDVPDEVEDEES